MKPVKSPRVGAVRPSQLMFSHGGIQQIEFRLVHLRVVVRHGLATADEDRCSVYRFNTEFGLKQPRFVLVHIW